MTYEEMQTILEALADETIYDTFNPKSIVEDVENVSKSLRDCKNELCLHCGKYKDNWMTNECRGCRWNS